MDDGRRSGLRSGWKGPRRGVEVIEINRLQSLAYDPSGSIPGDTTDRNQTSFRARRSLDAMNGKVGKFCAGRGLSAQPNGRAHRISAMLSETLAPASEAASDTDGMFRTPNALERKLSHHADFSRAEREALDRLLGRDVRTLKGRSLLVEEGSAPTEINVILAGWACRYKLLPSGRRQIVALYVPGDVCDFNVFLMTAFDQSIAAIDGARVAGIGRAALSELSKVYPRISRALWWESLAATATQREWLINIGQRNAKQRVAHLLCELIRRLEAAGLFDGDACQVPLSQADIADACAMTAVHTNRTLQALRKMGLASLQHGVLTVADRLALHAFAGFDPAYLQFGDPPQRRPSEAPVVAVA